MELLASLAQGPKQEVGNDAAFLALPPRCEKVRLEAPPEVQADRKGMERLVAIHAKTRPGNKQACEELAASRYRARGERGYGRGPAAARWARQGPAACWALTACCVNSGPEIAALRLFVRAVKRLAGLAKDSEPGVRSAAFWALTACCEHGGSELAARVEELLSGLSRDSGPGVRQAAAECLPASCKQGGAELAARVAVLIAGLAKDSEECVRNAAAKPQPACGPELAARVEELPAGLGKDLDPRAPKAAAKGPAACCEQGVPELAARVEELVTVLRKDSE